MEHMGTGLSLTVWGMGLVFLALALLQVLIVLLLRLDQGKAVSEAPRKLPDPPDDSPPVSAELLAAMAVAVRAHKRTLRRQAAPTMRSRPPSTLGSRWVIAGRTRQNRTWVSGGRHV